MTQTNKELLHAAAVFVDHDPGSPGFLDRFAEAVTGDMQEVSRALSQALAAREQAGDVSFVLGAGDLQVQATSSGASLTACAIAAADGGVVASVRLLDTDRRPVAGAAVGITGQGPEQVLVTGPGGQATTSAAADILIVRLGGGSEATANGLPEDGVNLADPPAGVTALSADLIELPRGPRRFQLTYAAATNADIPPGAADQGHWRIAVGGVEFLCTQHSGGCDITAELTGVPAAFADEAAGAYGVSFATLDREGRRRAWIMPLASRPQGLVGSVYGTDEYHLDRASVSVRPAGQLLSALGDELDEVIGRSVHHADSDAAWRALTQLLPRGPARSAVEAALDKRGINP
jgi:hypothetical protein